MESDSTKRFSDRVENYVKYRPGYPPAVIEFLKRELGLSPSSVIADIGSGTGILSELFLRNGNMVFAVEPNQNMREAAERLLESYTGFHSIAGTAETSTLEAGSVDFVTAGQAFHWFDLHKSKKEFARILRSGGWVVLLWNDRRVHTPFLAAYEDLLKRFGTDYQKVDHRNITDAVLSEFFAPNPLGARTLEYFQTFDLESLKGRLLSSSYIPNEGVDSFIAMMRELEDLFRRYESGGSVRMDYDTRLYFGHLNLT